jgi:uncharacterized damage-inducible protein DinB
MKQNDMKSYELLNELTAEVNDVLQTAAKVAALDDATLNMQPAPGKWSMAQVVEHLNTYNRYYLPLITKRMPAARKVAQNVDYKPGWLGDYFARSMYSDIKTKGVVVNKMSAMKGHVPDGVLNGREVINEFVTDCQLLLGLLEAARQVDMSSVKIPITIARWLKISMGDALRFVIAHMVRHMHQINNILVRV